MMTAEERDDYENSLIAAGAVLAVLYGARGLDTIEPVTDADGNLTNQIDVTISFLKSPYRVTVERVTDAKH